MGEVVEKGLNVTFLKPSLHFRLGIQQWSEQSVPVSNLLSIVMSALLVLLTIYFSDFNFSKIKKIDSAQCQLYYYFVFLKINLK